jgi:hypothetical protein
VAEHSEVRGHEVIEPVRIERGDDPPPDGIQRPAHERAEQGFGVWIYGHSRKVA